MDLHPIRPVGRIRLGINFWSIGLKFTQIVWPLTGNVISMDLHPIRPVEFYWALNTGKIGWKFTENSLYAWLVEFGGHNLNGFTPQFDRSNLTGH